jgi:Haem-degrading
VNRSGIVIAVTYSGQAEGDQWPASRVISAQKANTANALCLDAFALSTANLYAATQPGGSLFGLQASNPVNSMIAYEGDAELYGTPADGMIGKRIGGINVFGGGLGLYNSSGHIIGGLGVSGDYSCADHIIAWKVRSILELDYVPSGVDPTVFPGKPGDDNIIYDVDAASGKSVSGWGHPSCTNRTTEIGRSLPTTFPIRQRAK